MRARHIVSLALVTRLGLGMAAAVLAGVAMADASGASATEDVVHFEIPRQRGDQALISFAQQVGVPILFPFEIVSEVTANPLFGAYPVGEGLRILFEGTGLEGTVDERGQLTVRVLADSTDEREVPSEAPAASGPDALEARDAAIGRPGAPLHEIVVTGSRIRPFPGFATAVPVTAVTREELMEYEPGGTITEALDALPQFFKTETAQRGSGALFGNAGISSLNMRGMGAQRTLVLIDGARTVPADRNSRVNTDNIPSALVQRVDVVTGGASAAYGADALAGVTNFILDRRFEGFSLDLRAGQTAERDGQNWALELAAGTSFGAENRLRVTVGLGAQRVDQIERNAADEDVGPWFQRWGYVQNPEWFPGAPAGIPQRLTMPHVHSTLHTPGGLINEPGFSYDRQTFLPDGNSTRPHGFGDAGCYGVAGGDCTINTTTGGSEYDNATRAFSGGPFGFEVERNNVFLGLHYDLDARTELFGHFLAGETHSNRYGRRGNPHLMGVWHATIFQENPFLPEPLRQAMEAEGLDSFRLDKLGQIRAPGLLNFNDEEIDLNMFRTWSLAAGLERALFGGHNWSLRAQVQRGQTRKSTAVLNELRVDRMFLAIDAVRDPQTGAVICNVQRFDPTPEELQASVADVRVPASIGDDSLGGFGDLVPIPGPVAYIDNTIRDCVPLNIFGHGNVSPEAAQYVLGDKEGVGMVTQEFAEVLLTGDIAGGIGAGPFSMAAGATWRAEKFWQRSLPVELMAFGPVINAPELGIRGISAGWAGNRNVHQFSDVPAIDGKFHVTEVFAELDFPLLRTDRGRTLSTNLGWRHSDYSLSGGINSAKIGINLGLNRALRFRTTFSRDVREPTFSERFDFQGGGGSLDDPLFDGQQFQTTSVNGGNPALDPERADTFTGGFVYRPTAAPGLQVALDYYQIDLTDAVDQLGLQRIVDECFETGALCDQVYRDPNTNVVSLVENRFLNVAEAFVSGIDLDLLWTGQIDLFSGLSESLTLRVLSGYLIENSETPAGGRKMDHAGELDLPRYTAMGTLTYRAGPWRLRLQQRYIPRTVRESRWIQGVHVDNNIVQSQSWTNLTLGYHRNAWDAAVMVSNVFEADPPVIPSFSDRSGAQIVSNNYDVFGRRYALNFRYRF